MGLFPILHAIHCMTMSDEPANPVPPKALTQAVRRLLRPLVRGFVHFGLSWPILADILKHTYVDIAKEDFSLGAQKKITDSRISLLTRVHRKDIRRFRLMSGPPPLDMADLSVGAQVIARWQADEQYCDKNGQPKPLPRAGAGSFDELARSVSKDTHPRALYDELLRIGAVRMDDDLVLLDKSAFVPQADFDRLAWYYGLNLHDHIAASTHNMSGKTPPFLDRSVHYSGLSPASVAELKALSQDLGMEALIAINARARELEKKDQGADTATQRMTFGIYFYSEKNAKDD